MSKYLLDSNVFIQSKNFSYKFGFCQSFWDLILELHKRGLVYSLVKVKQELLKGKDKLANWVKTLPDSFWLDEFDYIGEYNKVINWANNIIVNPNKNQGFTTAAKEIFADEERADAWLVACASSYTDYVRVTQEVRVDPNAYKAIKIPNAASAFSVSCITVFDFLSATCENNFTPK